MNVWTVINNVVVLIGLIPCIGLSIHVGATLARRLPAQQRVALEQFARQAVQQVEQQYANQSSTSKKALALASIVNLFKAFGLPAPSPEAIDIAIEAAVLQLPQLPHKNDPPVANG